MSWFNPDTGQWESGQSPYEQGVPGSGYESPVDPVTGQPLGAPPNSDWDTETGTWHDAPGYTQGVADTLAPAPAPTAASPAPQTAAPAPSQGQMPPVQQQGQQQQQQQQYQPSGSRGTVDYYGDQFNSVLAALTQRLSEQQNFFQQYMQQQQAQAAAEQQRKAAYEDAIRQQILGIMNQNQGLDINNPGSDPASKAFATIQQRAADKFRADQAEQRAAQGIGQNQQGEVSGALAGDIGGAQSTLAENIAGFQSRMVVDQINQRRAQLMQALQIGAGLLGQDQQTAIQRELAQLDAALKQNLGAADIGLRSFQTQGNLSLGLLQSLMQNQQYYDRLGYDIGRDEQDFDLRSMGYF